MIDVAVREADIDGTAARSLIADLDADLQQRYPGALIDGVDVAEFRAAHGLFAVAWLKELPVGCGAFRPRGSDTVELKRMYVVPSYRSRGVARAVLAFLEGSASARGFSRAILETAIAQPEAISLYTSAGYQRIPAFEPYVGNSYSVCFAKRLAVAPTHG